MNAPSTTPYNTAAWIDTSDEVRPAVNQSWQARRELAEALRRLNSAALTADASADLLQSIAALVNDQAARVEASERFFGYRAHAEHIAAKEGITPDMSYETPPGMGQSNAIAPPLRVWTVDGRIHATATAGWGYEGPSEHLHGGIIALLFDQLIGVSAVTIGSTGRTGTLSIRYHNLTPLNKPLQLVADITRVEGRKQFISAELWADEVHTASCEAILITPRS